MAKSTTNKFLSALLPAITNTPTAQTSAQRKPVLKGNPATLPPIVSNILNAIGDMGAGAVNTFTNPMTDIAGMFNPQLKTTPDREASAQRFADSIAAGGPEAGAIMEGMAPSAEYLAGRAGSAARESIGAVKQATLDAVDTGMAQPGGLQAGFVGDARLPEIPEGAILDAKGKPVTSKPPIIEPKTGDKFIAEGELPQGRKPAEIRANAGQNPPRLNYVPTTITDNAALDLPPSILNPNAETFSAGTETPSAQIAPKPVEPQPSLSLRQKVIQKLNGIDNYQLGSKYGANRAPFEAQDKSVMQNVVGGNDANEVLKNVPGAKKKVWQSVEDSVSQHPAIDINKQIVPHIKAQLDDLVQMQLITPEIAEDALKGESSKMAGATMSPNPAVDGKKFLDIRTGANRIAQKGLGPSGELKDGATVQQIVNKAIADGYKEALTNVSPEAKYYSNQYSSLKRIEDMSNEFRNQNLTMGKIPKTNIGVIPMSGTVRKAAASTLNGTPNLAAKVIGGGGLLAAGVAGGVALNEGAHSNKDNPTNGVDYSQDPSQNGKVNNSPDHNSIILNNVTDVNQLPKSKQDIPDDYGVVDAARIKGADGASLILDNNQATAQVADLTNQKNQALEQIKNNPYNPKIKIQAQADIDIADNKINVLNNKVAISTGLQNGQEVATNAVHTLDDIKSLVKNSGKSLLNFNPLIDQFNTQLNSDHNKFQADLDALRKQGYTDLADTIQKAKAVDAAQGAISSGRQSTLDIWHTALKKYGGTSGASGTKATEQVPTAIRTLPSIPKQGGGVDDTRPDPSMQLGNSLPPIH